MEEYGEKDLLAGENKSFGRSRGTRKQLPRKREKQVWTIRHTSVRVLELSDDSGLEEFRRGRKSRDE